MTTPAQTPQQDPPVPTSPSVQRAVPPATAPTYDQDALYAAVEKARSEEKSKLYGKIEGLTSQFGEAQKQLQALQASESERQAAAKAEADRIAAEQKAAEEETLTLKQLIEKRDREANERFTFYDQELARRDALLAKEREFAELNEYKLARVSELREPHPENHHFGIADEFVDLVHGSTHEEIDASVATMIAKTRSIVEGMQQAQVSARAAMQTVSPGAGNFGPTEAQGSARQYSADDISAMDPDSEEFRALRQQYGIGRSKGNQGMFGEQNRSYFG